MRYVDMTTYTGEAQPRSYVRQAPRGVVRSELAGVLRIVRRNLDVVLLRDRRCETDGCERYYYVTNTQGPTRFERTLVLER